MRLLVLSMMLICVGCSDPARFRPAKGVPDLPSAKDAYRVQEPKEGCDDIGYVIEAKRIEDIATTAAAHGGTHYQVLDDFGGTSIETDSAAVATRVSSVTVATGHSSTYAVKHHVYTARVWRCSNERVD